ncbi:MAG: hypothetical protein Q9174_002234 [Haloplaca sp. 1 TL-2023]
MSVREATMNEEMLLPSENHFGSSDTSAGSVPVQVNDSKAMATHDLGPAKVFHGAFSSCHCPGCMEDAKKEAEKQYDDKSFAFGYIKKLEGLVDRLQVQNGSAIGALAPPIFGPAMSEMLDATTGDVEDLKPKVEIKRLRKVYTQHDDPQIEQDCSTPSTFGPARVSIGHVLTVYKDFDWKKNYWRRSTEIRSAPFIDLLRMIAPGIDLPAADNVLCLKEPLMQLFHNRTKLAAIARNQSNEETGIMGTEAKEHANLLLTFMEEECQDIVKVQDHLAILDISSAITYEHTWLLYAPGTIVVSKESGEYEAFVVESAHGCQRHQPSYNERCTHSALELICWSIQYDGEVFGRVWSNHYIAPFEASKEIQAMDVIPLDFLPDKESIWATLVKRGHGFWALQGQCFREYTGEVWSSHVENTDPLRVLVDHLTYQRRMNWPIEIDRKRGPANAQSKNWRENRFARGRKANPSTPNPRYPPPPQPRCHRRTTQAHGDDGFDPFVDIQPEHREEAYQRLDCDRPPQATNAFYTRYDSLSPNFEPDDLACLLAPQTVHGYCLRDKVWKNLNVTQLRPVTFRKNAWERLVLDEEYKDIVQAMVASYVDKTAKLDDLVAGKGAGLVTLLHGPPGTGKVIEASSPIIASMLTFAQTLTAECVAESFEKPLYQVTCGEIGTHASTLEERLEEIFDDAIRFNAILVLDEADVFLQERDYENLERNALVSIFLRALEYFNGVLFLTTNRVGTFDQAFQSRIHITLGLPILDQPRRTEVWMLFLEELAKSQQLTAGHIGELQKQVITTWSRQSLNGRQIRNNVRTALLVAEKKNELVSAKHFETVLRIGKEFENYMYILRQGNDAKAIEGGDV